MQDLLTVEDDVLSFQPSSDGPGGKGGRPGESSSSKALLNDADALWVEFRHQHIAKVSESIAMSSFGRSETLYQGGVKRPELTVLWV